MEVSATTRGEPLWQPKNISSTNIDKFRRFVNYRRTLQLRDTRQLHAWSVAPETVDDFWLDVFAFLEIKSDKIPERACNSNVSCPLLSISS
jgi:acetoacetyl-CoA synthetase